MDHSDEGMATLTSLASERGFIVRDVGRDGDCLFHAVQQQLQKLRVEVHKDALRQHLAAYLEDHPYSHHLRDVLSQAIQSNDTLNADTEQPTEEDERIESEPDPSTRQQLCWCKYSEVVPGVTTLQCTTCFMWIFTSWPRSTRTWSQSPHATLPLEFCISA